MDVPLLQVREMNVNYGSIRAVRGVSLVVNPGEVVALIGPNGAGKTTTLRAIAGLLKPASGELYFDGKEVRGTPPHRLARRGLTLVPEGRGILTRLTVRENLMLGATVRRSGREFHDSLKEVYARFPRLEERYAQNAGSLSGGEQQMLAIGRALMGRPRLLMLDEPSLGLAPLVVREIFAVIAELRRAGTTVLLVEQNARAALGVADRAYVLERGHVAVEGSGEELLAEERMIHAYLGELLEGNGSDS
jgi:branched-chain amino acid transport system ATP-binding protein